MENCESDENFRNAMASLTSVEPFCAGSSNFQWKGTDQNISIISTEGGCAFVYQQIVVEKTPVNPLYIFFKDF